jgi:hypothetical protein
MESNSKTVIKLLLLAMLATTIIFSTYLSSPQPQYMPHFVDTSVQSTQKKSQLSIVNQTKIVLLTYPQLWGFRFSMGRVGFINAGCEVSNCVLTTNHTYVKDYNFDAFLVHGPTQRKGPWILPNRRRDQVFILFSTEPPGNQLSSIHSHRKTLLEYVTVIHGERDSWRYARCELTTLEFEYKHSFSFRLCTGVSNNVTINCFAIWIMLTFRDPSPLLPNNYNRQSKTCK